MGNWRWAIGYGGWAIGYREWGFYYFEKTMRKLRRTAQCTYDKLV